MGLINFELCLQQLELKSYFYRHKPHTMKYIIKSALLLSTLLLLFSCGGNKNNAPETVAERFLNAVNNHEFEQAKELSTEDSHKMIDLIASFAKGVEEEEKVEKVVKVSKCNIDGETAVCDYCCDAEGQETTINLKQVEGLWKVDMSKETIFGEDNPLDGVNLNDLQSAGEDEDATMEEEPASAEE